MSSKTEKTVDESLIQDSKTIPSVKKRAKFIKLDIKLQQSSEFDRSSDSFEKLDADIDDVKITETTAINNSKCLESSDINYRSISNIETTQRSVIKDTHVSKREEFESIQKELV